MVRSAGSDNMDTFPCNENVSMLIGNPYNLDTAGLPAKFSDGHVKWRKSRLITFDCISTDALCSSDLGDSWPFEPSHGCGLCWCGS